MELIVQVPINLLLLMIYFKSEPTSSDVRGCTKVVVLARACIGRVNPVARAAV